MSDPDLNELDDDAEVTVITDNQAASPLPAGPPCLVVFYGDNIGRRHSLDKSEMVIGRGNRANLVLDSESASRQHAKIVIKEGSGHVYDLGSTNGTFVNDQRIADIALRDGDFLRVGSTIYKYLSGANLEAKYHEEIYRLTTIDGLTDAFNKRYFLEALTDEIGRAHRYQRTLSLAMVDIDHFKRVNDTFGHLAGDHVLRELAHLVQRNLRNEDIFARYGGEEFALILPEIDGPGALRVCDKLRRLVEEKSFGYDGQLIPVTVSMGLRAYLPGEPQPDPETFIAVADAKLYEAKQGGRNRVCL